MIWVISVVVVFGLVIGARRWQSSRPPLAERIQQAMDAEFSSRVRKAPGLPASHEFDFLFEVSDESQAEHVISSLVALGLAAQADKSPPDGRLIRATVMADPSTIDFAVYRQQFSSLCKPPVVVYLGLGEASYKAAGVKLPNSNEQQSVSSPSQA